MYVRTAAIAIVFLFYLEIYKLIILLYYEKTKKNCFLLLLVNAYQRFRKAMPALDL